jgi:hypothetical protein
MMMLKVAYFVNLVLARLLVRNEFGPRWPSTRLSLVYGLIILRSSVFSATLGEEIEVELG